MEAAMPLTSVMFLPHTEPDGTVGAPDNVAPLTVPNARRTPKGAPRVVEESLSDSGQDHA